MDNLFVSVNGNVEVGVDIKTSAQRWCCVTWGDQYYLFD
jgi:hypothetical protein